MGPPIFPIFTADVFLVLKMLQFQSAPSPMYFKLNLNNFEIDIRCQDMQGLQPKKRIRVLHLSKATDMISYNV